MFPQPPKAWIALLVCSLMGLEAELAWGQFASDFPQVPALLPEPPSMAPTLIGLPVREYTADPPQENSPKADAKQDGKKPPARVNYIPEQKPISQINIDINSKAKGNNSVRPESTQSISASEFPAVMAAPAHLLQYPLVHQAQRTQASFPHKPLYFEEINLEGYGRSWGVLQPAISTTRFFATVPLLPYKMVAYPPCKEYYMDWPYEVGRPAPRVSEMMPINPKAAIVEAGVLTGAAFLIP